MYYRGPIEDYYMWNKSDAVNQICKPLFDKYNLNYFNYSRMYPDGSIAALTNKPEFCVDYVKKDFKISASIKKPGIYLWAHENQDCDEIHELESSHDIPNGIEIMNAHSDYCEFIHFSAPQDNKKAINFYLNNLNLLTQFLLYFKEQANDLVANSVSRRLIMPGGNIGKLALEKDSDQDFEIIKEFSPNKIYVDRYGRDIILTRREYECYTMLVKGNSPKVIATLLDISVKTVEGYLANVRHKTGCSSRTQLFDFYQEYLALGQKVIPELA